MTSIGSPSSPMARPPGQSGNIRMGIFSVDRSHLLGTREKKLLMRESED